MERLAMLKITEDRKLDISTVFAYLNVWEKIPGEVDRQFHCFTNFSKDYGWGKERDFIEELEAKRPGTYSHYHISWFHCN